MTMEGRLGAPQGGDCWCLNQGGGSVSDRCRGSLEVFLEGFASRLHVGRDRKGAIKGDVRVSRLGSQGDRVLRVSHWAIRGQRAGRGQNILFWPHPVGGAHEKFDGRCRVLGMSWFKLSSAADLLRAVLPRTLLGWPEGFSSGDPQRHRAVSSLLWGEAVGTPGCRFLGPSPHLQSHTLGGIHAQCHPS